MLGFVNDTITEERAAILEYDGGLTREQAEQNAYRLWLRTQPATTQDPLWAR